jgi:hypothetical protein
LWDQALYGDRLLPAGLRELLFKPNLENYGFGWGILIPKPGSPNAGQTVLNARRSDLRIGFAAATRNHHDRTKRDQQ